MMSKRAYFVDAQRIIRPAQRDFSRAGVAMSPQFQCFSTVRRGLRSVTNACFRPLSTPARLGFRDRGTEKSFGRTPRMR
jgi:hypothetical protein